MPYDLNSNPIWCECPCCVKYAEGVNEIDDLFGFRNMGDGREIPQSYCRDCRSVHCEANEPCKVNN